MIIPLIGIVSEREMVQKWESNHENHFVHSFLTVALSLSYISCFHTFVLGFFIKTEQGPRKMFSADVHEQQIP